MSGVDLEKNSFLLLLDAIATPAHTQRATLVSRPCLARHGLDSNLLPLAPSRGYNVIRRLLILVQTLVCHFSFLSFGPRFMKFVLSENFLVHNYSKR